MSWFGKRQSGESGEEKIESALSRRDEAMKKALQDASANDPHIFSKVTAKELKANLLEVLKDERGVHIESAFAALGSLGGFACLIQAWFEQKANVEQGKPRGVHEIGTADGRRFYFGDLINAPLLENPLSIWGLTGGMAQHLGARSLPDVMEIVTHVVKSVGSESFGAPRIPEGHRPMLAPIAFVTHLWPKLVPVMTRYSNDARALPITAGFCIQQLMEEGRNTLDPALAALIVMECAVPMAHIDPNALAADMGD